jgi:preprotein translocase subunit SecE
MGKITNFFRGVIEEFRKVSWPTREELSESTFLVIFTIFLIAVFLWGVDKFLEMIVRKLFGG